MVIVRKDLVSLLDRKFSGQMDQAEILSLAREITALQEDWENEWEEVEFFPGQLGLTLSVGCPDICSLAEAIEKGDEFRFFRRKEVQA